MRTLEQTRPFTHTHTRTRLRVLPELGQLSSRVEA